MNLSSLLLDRLKGLPELPSGGNKSSNAPAANAFDSVFEIASKKQTDSAKDDRNAYAQKTSRATQSRTEKNTRQDKARENMYKANNNKKDLVTNDRAKDTKATDPAKPQKTNKEAVKDIAKALGVKQEKVQDALDELDLTVEDLTQKDNLNAFMQVVMDVQSPMELLSVDGVKDLLDTVRGIAAQVGAAGQTQLAQEEQQPLEDEEQGSLTEATSGQTTKTAAEKQGTSMNEENDGTNKTITAGMETVAPNPNHTEQQQAVVAAANKEVAAGGIASVASGSNAGNSNLNNQNASAGESAMLNAQPMTGLGTTQDTSFKTFTETVSKADPMRNLDAHNVIEQMVQKFKADYHDKMTEIKITLRPDFLGDVSLKLVSDNGVISAVFSAQNDRVKEIIESNFNKLKDVLSEAGVQVSELSVSVGQEDTGGNQQLAQEQTKSQRRIQNIMQGIASEGEEQRYIEESEIVEANVNYKA